MPIPQPGIADLLKEIVAMRTELMSLGVSMRNLVEQETDEHKRINDMLVAHREAMESTPSRPGLVERVRVLEHRVEAMGEMVEECRKERDDDLRAAASQSKRVQAALVTAALALAGVAMGFAAKWLGG